MMTLDKSTADILSPLMVVIFGQPQQTTLGEEINSLPQDLHLTLRLFINQSQTFYLSWAILDSNQ